VVSEEQIEMMQIDGAQYTYLLFLAVFLSIAGASINLAVLWRLPRHKGTTKPQAIYVIGINLLGLSATLLIGLPWSPNSWAFLAITLFVWSFTWFISLCFFSTWVLPDRLFFIFFIISEVFYLIHKLAVLRSLNLDMLNSVITLTLLTSELFTLIACSHSVFDVLAAMNIPKTPILPSSSGRKKGEFPLGFIKE
jgi:hypothetical protein